MLLLLLETSAAHCSVALCNDTEVLSSVMADNANSHTEEITILIQKACDITGIALQQIDGVALSHGPGSYTSLRVGVSAAKAICFALSVPLISINSDEILVAGIDWSMVSANDVILPMIDARRMEIYYSMWDFQALPMQSIQSFIIENAIPMTKAVDRIHLCGSGAQKYIDNIVDARHVLHHTHPLAAHMAPIAYQMYAEKNFVNLVPYSPLYFKEPNITQSTKKIN